VRTAQGAIAALVLPGAFVALAMGFAVGLAAARFSAMGFIALSLIHI